MGFVPWEDKPEPDASGGDQGTWMYVQRKPGEDIDVAVSKHLTETRGRRYSMGSNAQFVRTGAAAEEEEEEANDGFFGGLARGVEAVGAAITGANKKTAEGRQFLGKAYLTGCGTDGDSIEKCGLNLVDNLHKLAPSEGGGSRDGLCYHLNLSSIASSLAGSVDETRCKLLLR